MAQGPASDERHSTARAAALVRGLRDVGREPSRDLPKFGGCSAEQRRRPPPRLIGLEHPPSPALAGEGARRADEGREQSERSCRYELSSSISTMPSSTSFICSYTSAFCTRMIANPNSRR